MMWLDILNILYINWLLYNIVNNILFIKNLCEVHMYILFYWLVLFYLKINIQKNNINKKLKV